MKSANKIRKGTIVWYYDDLGWKRGKVTCVNKYHVDVKPRHGKMLSFRYNEPVIPASEVKPECTPALLRARLWNRNQWQNTKNYRFLRQLGFA